MKTVLRVAGTELRTLFYSPIAWFVLVVFLVQSGIVYFGIMDGIASQQEMGGFRLRYIMNLMSRVFVGKNALFSGMMENLYLYIPLLTMGLISRETSSGTIKLLYSSPIRIREIVLGKYLAMLLYSLLLVAIIGLFVVTGICQVQAPDKGMLMTGLLGFYLLLCAYSAIGLFMSCLTTYQIVAAVCTFVMIGFLSYVGSLWQGLDFFRDITYFLSIAGRTEKMLMGLLTTKDVVYFLVIIYIFIGLSIYRLRAGVESKPALVKAGRYAMVVAGGLLAGYIGSLPALTGYYDATGDKRNTVLPHVRKIVEDLGDAPLEVMPYNNVLGGYSMMGMDQNYNRLMSTWDRYMRFKKGHNIIVHKAIHYYDSTLENNSMMMGYPGKSLKEIAQQITRASGMSMKNVLSPEEMRKIIDLRPELNRYVMKLKYKDRTTFLRIFDDQMVWPGETEVSAAFKRLMMAKLPKVGFLAGNMERSIFRRGDRDYTKMASAKQFRYSLVNQGFDVDTVSVETRDVPDDISVLVIADPKFAFSEAAMERLRKFIDGGGNLLITCEPGNPSVLKPVLDQLGVGLVQGQIVQEDKDRTPDVVLPDLTVYAGQLSKYVEDIRKDTVGEKIVMNGVAGITYTEGGAFTVKPLLMSDPKLTWNRVKELDPDLMISAVGGPVMMGSSSYVDAEPANAPPPPVVKGSVKPVTPPAVKKDLAAGTTKKDKPDVTTVASVSTAPAPSQPGPGRRSRAMGTISFSPEDGDAKGALPTAITLSRNVNGKEQRIVVTGDADFMKNGSHSQVNFTFSTSLFSWLSYGEFPIDSYRPATRDTAVYTTTDQLSFMRIIYIWVLPGLLVAFASILLIRRKRK